MAICSRYYEARSRMSSSTSIPLHVSVSRPSCEADIRMLYHAAYILLHRPIFDAAEISNASGAVATCIEHSAAANDLAVSFTSTFGERMTYVAVYSSFVAA